MQDITYNKRHTGILTLQPTSQPRTKAAGLIRHQIYIGLIGVPIIFAGTWAVYHNKNINGRSHFVTWHGVCIVFLFCFSFTLLTTIVHRKPIRLLEFSPLYG